MKKLFLILGLTLFLSCDGSILVNDNEKPNDLYIVKSIEVIYRSDKVRYHLVNHRLDVNYIDEITLVGSKTYLDIGQKVYFVPIIVE